MRYRVKRYGETAFRGRASLAASRKISGFPLFFTEPVP
jgi:hypothetical protein